MMNCKYNFPNLEIFIYKTFVFCNFFTKKTFDCGFE